MKEKHASQIAELLNTRNKLVRRYSTEMILGRSDDFLFELKDDDVIACIEAKEVQWYQWEVCHLTVAEKYEGQGYGSRMIRMAEEKAIDGGARIIQCTIRVCNTASARAFERNGYKQVSCFYYPNSGNDVNVWQKVVSFRPDSEG